MKFLLRIVTVLFAFALFSGSANATLIFDSANGVNTASSPTNGVTGFLTGISVSSNTTINRIEQLTYASDQANMKFAIFDYDTTALLWLGASGLVDMARLFRTNNHATFRFSFS